MNCFRLAKFLMMLGSIAFIVTGCTTSPTKRPKLGPEQPNEVVWENHQQKVMQITHWNAEGKVSVQSQKETFSASLNWEENNSHYKVVLRGPLGQGTVTLEGMPQQVMLTLSNGQKHMAATPESLLTQYTHWSLPVNQLKYWMRGIPDPTLPVHISLNENGYLNRLDQGIWHVQYLDYDDAQGIALPKKISIESYQFKLKAIINKWSLGY